MKLSEIKNNYSGNFYIVNVPHQRSPNGYWRDGLDDIPEDHDYHTRHVCETVEEIVALTVATDGKGSATRHQAAKIATYAIAAIKALFSDAICSGLSNWKLWADDVTADIDAHLKAEHGDDYKDWLDDEADYAGYADHFCISNHEAELYGVEIMAKLLTK